MKKCNIRLTSQELEKLCTVSTAQVSLSRAARHLELHPNCSNDIISAINDNLDNLISKFDSGLSGIIMGYRNVTVMSDIGGIVPEDHHIHVNVCADFYVFRPFVGTVLKGVINKKSKDHIGCLIHQCFNVSVPKSNEDNLNEWHKENLQIGQEAFIKVTFLNFGSSIPVIKGSLLPNSVESCETSNEKVKKKKKKAKKTENLFNEDIKENVEFTSKLGVFEFESNAGDNWNPSPLKQGIIDRYLINKEEEETEPISKKKKSKKKRKLDGEDDGDLKMDTIEELDAEKIELPAKKKKKKKDKKREKENLEESSGVGFSIEDDENADKNKMSDKIETSDEKNIKSPTLGFGGVFSKRKNKESKLSLKKSSSEQLTDKISQVKEFKDVSVDRGEENKVHVEKSPQKLQKKLSSSNLGTKITPQGFGLEEESSSDSFKIPLNQESLLLMKENKNRSKDEDEFLQKIQGSQDCAQEIDVKGKKRKLSGGDTSGSESKKVCLEDPKTVFANDISTMVGKLLNSPRGKIFTSTPGSDIPEKKIKSKKHKKVKEAVSTNDPVKSLFSDKMMRIIGNAKEKMEEEEAGKNSKELITEPSSSVVSSPSVKGKSPKKPAKKSVMSESIKKYLLPTNKVNNKQTKSIGEPSINISELLNKYTSSSLKDKESEIVVNKNTGGEAGVENAKDKKSKKKKEKTNNSKKSSEEKKTKDDESKGKEEEIKVRSIASDLLNQFLKNK